MLSLRHSFVLASALALVIASNTAQAAGLLLHVESGFVTVAEPEPQNTRAHDDELKRLFKAASARYSASDYRGAIDGFVKVLTLLESEGGDARIRGAILFNLGQSYEHAFETERQIRYLRLARDTYTRYIREAGQGLAYDDVPAIQARLDQVEASLAQLDRPALNSVPAPENVETSGVATSPLPPQVQPIQKPAVQLSPAYRKARRMRNIGIGLTSASAGIAAVGTLMAWYSANFAELNADLSIDDPEAYRAQRQTAQAMTVTCLTLGLGGLAAGVPLWIIGQKRARIERRAITWLQHLNMGLVPQPGGARLSWSGRF